MHNLTSPLIEIDKRAAKPFFYTRRQARIALQLLPLLLAIWVIFAVGFKWGLNPFGDEHGYHDGGVLLAQSLNNGTFFKDALNEDWFKYPGYYALAGVVYFIFGEFPLMLRAFGLIPFLGLALLVANMASLVVGERTRLFATVAVGFSPVLFYFSMTLLRDIYILFAVALVLHATLAHIQLQLPLRRFFSPAVAFAFLLLFLFRPPQLAITLAILAITLMIARSLSVSRRWRFATFVLMTILLVAFSVLLRDKLVMIVTQAFFEGQERTITTSQYAALSNFEFTSVDEMISAFLNPKFLLIAMIAKLSSFTLGPHPFSVVENGPSIWDLFDNFQPEIWGGGQWEDIFLVNGLQWIPHFLFLPFLMAGLIGLWRYNRKIMFALATVWLSYAALTLFSGNETRWGLPILLVYYTVAAIGYGWYGAKLRLMLMSAVMLMGLVLIRNQINLPLNVIMPVFLGVILYGWYTRQLNDSLILVAILCVCMVLLRFKVPVPMIAAPMALFGYMMIVKIKPIGFPRAQNRPSVVGPNFQP